MCKPGWNDQDEEYCYKEFFETPLIWINAHSKCREIDGYLVGIRDERKQNYIQGTYISYSL